MLLIPSTCTFDYCLELGKIPKLQTYFTSQTDDEKRSIVQKYRQGGYLHVCVHVFVGLAYVLLIAMH